MKKVLTAALLAAGLIVTTATAASAHHPIVSGKTVCAENGKQTITWTVRNSESVTGTNRTMEIDQVSIDRGKVSFTVGQDFAPTPTAGSTQSSTSTYDGDETGNVTLKVRVDFSGQNGPKDIKGEATVKLVGKCVAVTTSSSSTSSTSTSTSTSTSSSSTSTSTTSTTQPGITATVQPAVAEKAAVAPTQVLGVQLTAPAPVGGVQTGGGGTRSH